MYSLDINFLNDREDRTVDLRPAPRAAMVPTGDRRPVWLGLAAGLAFVALAGIYWLSLRGRVAELSAESAELDQQIAAVQRELQELSGLQAQIDAVEAEIQAYVAIFDQILPWSALMQELRNNTPARVQIETLQQTAGNTLEDQTGAEPPAAGGIELTGKACSFDDVNDFMLLLQRSPLLDGNSVQLTRSQRPNAPLSPEEGSCPGTPQGIPEFLVEYSIRANLTPTPSTELVEELDNRGTVGLVTRIRALRETGVIGGAQTAVPEVTETSNQEATQE